MKFRAPTDTPVRVALTTGHVTVITREWRELDPMFHADALAQHCECDQQFVHSHPVSVQAGPNAINQEPSVDGLYRKALATMLERNEEGDFNRDGLPNTNAVSELAGFGARKEDVLRVFREMEAESEADDAQGSDPVDGGGTAPPASGEGE